MTTKGAGQGAKTQIKEQQFSHVLYVDAVYHCERRPQGTRYTCIDLYVGTYKYREEDGTEFLGSGATFCHAADELLDEWKYIAFEYDEKCADNLREGLAEYSDNALILNRSNETAPRFLKLHLKPDEHGIIIADANGMFDFDLL